MSKITTTIRVQYWLIAFKYIYCSYISVLASLQHQQVLLMVGAMLVNLLENTDMWQISQHQSDCEVYLKHLQDIPERLSRQIDNLILKIRRKLKFLWRFPFITQSHRNKLLQISMNCQNLSPCLCRNNHCFKYFYYSSWKYSVWA